MIDNLPPLREIVKKHQLNANKALGQCFLFDFNLITKILSFCGNLDGQQVIEIGPGPGGLTRALLAAGAYVTTLEYDLRCKALLNEISDLYPGRLDVHFQDALKTNFEQLAYHQQITFCANSNGKKPKIIANLPYNIGTELLIRWLTYKNWPPFYDSLTLMFQKEVAERITAEPNSKAYGRLTVLANWRTEAKILMHVPPTAFHPSPKIWSSIVQLKPKTAPLTCSLFQLERVTKAAFEQRRKMLRQSLKKIAHKDCFKRSNIDETRRPETLSVEEFVNLANHLDH